MGDTMMKRWIDMSLSASSRRAACGVLFALLGLLAACGGSSDSDPALAIRGPLTLQAGDRVRLFGLPEQVDALLAHASDT